MFKKKEKVDITPGTPVFSVRYIGKTQTFTPGGKGCTRKPVQHIWDNAEEEKYLRRVNMLVMPSGIVLQNVEDRKKETQFDIHHIAYCCAEPGVHERIFAWICKDDAAKILECHAVLCTSKDKAQTIAVLMSRAFHMAYKDWKSDKEKTARLKKNDHLRTSTVSTSSNASRSSSDASKDSFSSGHLQDPHHHGDGGLANGVRHMNITAETEQGREDFFIMNNAIFDGDQEENISDRSSLQNESEHELDVSRQSTTRSTQSS